MIERIFARQMENGLWQWRLQGKQGWLNDGYFTGDIEALRTSLEGRSDLPVYALLRGANCVSLLEVAETKNRRTLAKLLPYELEDDIIDPIDELHFAFGEIEDMKVPLVYTRADMVEDVIGLFAGIDCDVELCLPDYLLVECPENELLVIWDEDEVLACYGNHQGFAVQTDIGQLYLKQLELTPEQIQKITLVAASSEACDELMSWLPSSLYEGPEIVTREGGFWDCIPAGENAGEINLRSGQFARQLPLQRWWQTWQVPVYFAAAAVVFSVAVNYAMFLEAKGEYREILEARKEIFLKAVPNGRWQTPERELRARLGEGTADSGGTNFMALMESIAKTMGAMDNVNLGSLRYSGDQRELIVSFEVGNFSDVEKIRSDIEKLGFKAETLRAAARDDNFQARIKISQTGATS